MLSAARQVYVCIKMLSAMDRLTVWMARMNHWNARVRNTDTQTDISKAHYRPTLHPMLQSFCCCRTLNIALGYYWPVWQSTTICQIEKSVCSIFKIFLFSQSKRIYNSKSQVCLYSTWRVNSIYYSIQYYFSGLNLSLETVVVVSGGDDNDICFFSLFQSTSLPKVVCGLNMTPTV